MKRIILLLLAFCPLLLFTNCEGDVDAIHISEYVYVNNTSETVTISARGVYWDKEYENIKIRPGEEYIKRYGIIAFVYPFFENGMVITQITADNGEKFTLSKLINENEMTGLFNTDNYELAYERKRERHYRFIFTDDYFKDGEPIENMPE